MENKPTFEVRDMTGTLWMELQTKAGKNGEYQAYTGSVKIFGKEMYINAYPKTLPSGKNLLSLSFREKQPKAPSGPMQVVDAAPIFNDVKKDEIPLNSCLLYPTDAADHIQSVNHGRPLIIKKK